MKYRCFNPFKEGSRIYHFEEEISEADYNAVGPLNKRWFEPIEDGPLMQGVWGLDAMKDATEIGGDRQEAPVYAMFAPNQSNEPAPPIDFDLNGGSGGGAGASGNVDDVRQYPVTEQESFSSENSPDDSASPSAE